MSAAATTTTVTQHGIQRPDGEIAWGTSATPYFAGVGITSAATNELVSHEGKKRPGREVMREALHKVAKQVGVNPEEFVAAHTYVSRDILTITMEPVAGEAASHLTNAEMPWN